MGSQVMAAASTALLKMVMYAQVMKEKLVFVLLFLCAEMDLLKHIQIQ